MQVDNSWFPPNTTRTPVYGYYLPAGMNPLKELSNPESQYPHPFNFTIERKSLLTFIFIHHLPSSPAAAVAVAAIQSLFSFPPKLSLTHPPASFIGLLPYADFFLLLLLGPQLPSLDDSSGGDGHHSSLPGWAIALITVFSIGAVALAAFLLALCIRRRRHDQQQHHHDIYPVGYDPYHHDDEHHQQQQPVMRGVSTTTDTGSSIYSTTPMMHATFSAPRLSSGNYSSRRSSNAMAPPNTAAILNNRSAVSHSTSSFITDAPVPSTASSSRLADSTFMWMVDSSSQEHTTTMEEQRRRQLGEALLAQQLSEEEGASVKHAEKRPITVNGIRSEESRAVLEER